MCESAILNVLNNKPGLSPGWFCKILSENDFLCLNPAKHSQNISSPIKCLLLGSKKQPKIISSLEIHLPHQNLRSIIPRTMEARWGNHLYCTTKDHSTYQIFRHGRSIFCLPHQLKFSDFFDLLLHWVFAVHVHYKWSFMFW